MFVKSKRLSLTGEAVPNGMKTWRDEDSTAECICHPADGPIELLLRHTQALYPACLGSSQRVSNKLSRDTISNGVERRHCLDKDKRPLVSQQAIPAVIRGADASRARGYTMRGYRGNRWERAFCWVRYVSALTKGSEEPA